MKWFCVCKSCHFSVLLIFFHCEMSDIEISIPFTKFTSASRLNKTDSVNNNNKRDKNEVKFSYRQSSRSVSPRIMSPELNSQREIERHSPFHGSTVSSTPPPLPPSSSSHSASPSSVSPRTMSPPSEQRAAMNVYSTDGYQPNYIGAMTSYQTSMPPKKSFCIDALLSKNSANAAGNATAHSPETIRYVNDDDAGKYSDEQREYASSPDEGNSR